MYASSCPLRTGVAVSIGLVLLMAVTGSEGAMDCGVISCPNLITKAYDSITDSDSKSFCCRGLTTGLPYCCDWKDYGAYIFGLDPDKLQIPFGAILGLVIGGVVLLVMLMCCCCWCLGWCCFRGRRRTITEHHTVAFGKVGGRA